MACSSCARCTPTSIACACVALSWVSACSDVRARGDARRVAVPRELERPLEAGDGLVEEPALRVERRAAGSSPWRAPPGGSAARTRGRRRSPARSPRWTRRSVGCGPTGRAPTTMSMGSWSRGGVPGVDAAVAQGRRCLAAGQPPRPRDRRKVRGTGSLTSARAWRSWASAAASSGWRRRPALRARASRGSPKSSHQAPRSVWSRGSADLPAVGSLKSPAPATLGLT